MTIDCEQALVYKLANTAGVSALVSTRIHPERLPETAVLPAITYQLIDGPIEATHDEAATGALTHPRYQIDAWATTYSGMAAVAKAIYAALHGFKGVITSGADTFTYQSCLRVDKRDISDPETGLYARSQDFIIWHSE